MSAETETPREPWWVHHADHMKGWEAFGVSDSIPTVRRLGIVTHRKGHATTDERPGTTPFGSGEVKLGVAGVEFSTHADSPGTAFICVLGTTEADVTTAWYRANAVFGEIASRLWPSSRNVSASVGGGV